MADPIIPEDDVVPAALTAAEVEEATRTAYEVCPQCRGAGLQYGINGPVNCWTCHGWTTIRIRDDKGRFATKEAGVPWPTQ